MSHIVFLDVEPQDQSLVLQHFPDARILDVENAEEAIVKACKDAEVISTFIHHQFTAEVIQQLPQLKLICTRSVGFDHIDLDACKEHGVLACNVPDYGSHVIAEHVFALLLSKLRHITEGEKRVESGVFDYRGLRGMALKGKTIGIFGTGKIGRKVAKIAHGYEMNIIATDQCRTVEIEKEFGVKYVKFDELLEKSDILTIHVPASKETEHIFNENAFNRMKKGVVLVNTARGSLIDSSALLKALESGKVAYALLDVLEHELNFKENETLIKHPSVVATPHIAFYADDSMRNMFLDCFESIRQWQAGEEPAHVIRPLNVVCDLPTVKK